VEALRAELNQLYNRAGRPSKADMALKSGRSPVTFAFLDATGLPDWQQVSALLVATGTNDPAVRAKWQEWWTRVDHDQQRHQTAARPEDTELSLPQLLARMRDNGKEVPGPLSAALEAVTAADFAAALEQLRQEAGLSYDKIAKASRGRLSKSTAQRLAKPKHPGLPKRSDLVTAYVRACGVGNAEAGVWSATLHRLRRNEAPQPVRAGDGVPAAWLQELERIAGRSGSGQGVLATLLSTEHFVHRDSIDLAGRKLILFLTVALVDDTGQLTTAYQAILDRWSAISGHWTCGKQLAEMSQYMSVFLGRDARTVPTWEVVRDSVTAALGPSKSVGVLTDAAGLYCKATGSHRPPSYTGEIHLPWWGDSHIAVVTTDMVNVYLPASAAQPETLEAGAKDQELKTLKEDNELLRINLDTALRAFRDVDAHNQVLQRAAFRARRATARAATRAQPRAGRHSATEPGLSLVPPASHANTG